MIIVASLLMLYTHPIATIIVTIIILILYKQNFYPSNDSNTIQHIKEYYKKDGIYVNYHWRKRNK